MDEAKQKYVAKEARVKKRKGRKKKERRKVPQTQAHQVKWDEWLVYPPYA